MSPKGKYETTTTPPRPPRHTHTPPKYSNNNSNYLDKFDPCHAGTMPDSTNTDTFF